jgi:phage terminase large subunit
MELTLDLHAKQIHAFDLLTRDAAVKEVLFGGAKNGGKSYLGVSWIFGSALLYPGTRWFIARKELNDLRKHTTPTIQEWFKNQGLNADKYARFNGQDNYYKLANGSLVFLIDCRHMPADEMYERFGSLQFTGGWIEEGGEIPFAAYENLKLSIGRWLNDQFGLRFKLLITCNPKKNWMYTDFYKPAKEGKLEKSKAFIQALVTDNTFRQSGSVEVLDGIKDKITKQRLRFGEWEYVNDPSCLMEYDNIISIFTNNHVAATGKMYMSVDVAREGSDKTKIRVWNGLRVIHVASYEKQRTNVTAECVKALAIKFNVPLNNIVIDEDGIGGGVVDQFPQYTVKGFKANNSPVNPKKGESFGSLKDQCAWKLAELVNANRIYEPQTDTQQQESLITDLEQIKDKDIENDKKREIISKKDVKKAIGRSPDDGDTYIMRMLFELTLPGVAPIKRTGTVTNGRTIHNM